MNAYPDIEVTSSVTILRFTVNDHWSTVTAASYDQIGQYQYQYEMKQKIKKIQTESKWEPKFSIALAKLS